MQSRSISEHSIRGKVYSEVSRKALKPDLSLASEIEPLLWRNDGVDVGAMTIGPVVSPFFPWQKSDRNPNKEPRRAEVTIKFGDLEG